MKSAYELAMERLRQKDKDAGVEERPVTEEQKAAIADLRSLYESKLAEREILYQSALARTPDPEAREVITQEYRRDRERLVSERDRRIEESREKR
jgi:hypothetical protein